MTITPPDPLLISVGVEDGEMSTHIHLCTQAILFNSIASLQFSLSCDPSFTVRESAHPAIAESCTTS